MEITLQPIPINISEVTEKMKQDYFSYQEENATKLLIAEEQIKLDELFKIFQTGDLYDFNKAKLLNNFTKNGWIVGYEDKFFELLIRILNTSFDKNVSSNGFSQEMIREQMKRDIIEILEDVFSYEFSHSNYPEPQDGYQEYYELITNMFIELTNYNETKKYGLLFLANYVSDERFKSYYDLSHNSLNKDENEMLFNIRAVNKLMQGDDPYYNTQFIDETNKYVSKKFLRKNIIAKIPLLVSVADNTTLENIKKNDTLQSLLEEKPINGNEVSFISWLKSIKAVKYENEYINFLNENFASFTFNEKYWFIKKMTSDFFLITSALDFLHQQANNILLSKDNIDVQPNIITSIYIFYYTYTFSSQNFFKLEIETIINKIILNLNTYQSESSKIVFDKLNSILNNSFISNQIEW
jgi:hypothetical protein